MSGRHEVSADERKSDGVAELRRIIEADLEILREQMGIEAWKEEKIGFIFLYLMIFLGKKNKQQLPKYREIGRVEYELFDEVDKLGMKRYGVEYFG